MFTLKVNGYTKAGYGVQFEVPNVALSNIAVAVEWWDAQLSELGILGVVLSDAQRQEHLNAPIDEKMCPIHNVLMVKHTKGKGSWYSHHLDDGTWCRGEVNGG